MNSPIFHSRWPMPLLDAVLVFCAFALAYYIRYELQVLRPVFEKNVAPFSPYLPYIGVYIAWMYMNYRGGGLYTPVRGRPWLEEVYLVINGVTNATLIVMALSFFLQPVVFSRLMLIYVAAISVILLSLSRAIQRIVQANLRSKGIGVERVLIIGAGEVGQSVLSTMLARKELGYLPVGYLDDNPNRGNVDLGRLKGLGNINNLPQVISAHKVDTVVITLKWMQHDWIIGLIRAAQQTGASVRIVPDVFQLNLRQVEVENLDGIPLLGVGGDVQFYASNRLLKRAIDLGLILISLPVWVCVFVLVALAIRLEGPGPILYEQQRVGENGKLFSIIKFRSMIPDADNLRQELIDQHQLDPRHPKIPNDPRVTRVGQLIRKMSLDELPNLINVIRGHMSLVGPRPPTPEEVELYEPWHRQRLQIMPGMTGLWQISGRSDVPFDEMCLLDIYYIENWSIKLDVQILMMTLPRVLLRQGAY